MGNRQIARYAQTHHVYTGKVDQVVIFSITKCGRNTTATSATTLLTKAACARSLRSPMHPFHSSNILQPLAARLFCIKAGPAFLRDRGHCALRRLRPATSTFEDLQFTAFAQSTCPNSIGTKLLASYPVDHVSNVAVNSTPDHFPDTCETAATSFLACGTAIVS